MDELFFKPRQPVAIHGNNLPHWQQERVWQFVTFRLKDSIPVELTKSYLSERDRWLAVHPEPWSSMDRRCYHEQFTQRIHTWLDKGYGKCPLRHIQNRQAMASVIMRDHPVRAEMVSWIIMPNHVHLLFSPRIEINTLIRCWKGVSARKIGLGPIWQSNYYDTMIRNRRHFNTVVDYIRNNAKRMKRSEFTYWENQVFIADQPVTTKR